MIGTLRTYRWPIAAVAATLLAGSVGAALIGLHWAWTALIISPIVAGALALLARRQRRSHHHTEPGIGSVAAHFGLITVLTLVLIQLVPHGRDHSNPPVTGEPAWSSPRTRELMVNACYGCHSNEVDWPWYSSIAPISRAVTDHVNEGRDAVNYSEFATNPGEAEETIEVVLDGSMPPTYYTRFGLHPEANLTDTEIAELIDGLRTTPGLSEDDDHREDDDDD